MLSVAIAMMMISGAFMVLAPMAVAKAPPVIADPDGIDLGFEIRAQVFDPPALSQNGHTVEEAAPGDYWVVGDRALYYTGAYGKTAFMQFSMRGSGTDCELWTAEDMLFPVGDPRNAFTSRISITDQQVEYIIGQYDNTVSPLETEYYAPAPPRNGSGGLFEEHDYPEAMLFRTHQPGKLMIMVFNIVDENYWNVSYPYMVLGYFSPSLSDDYARNIIHLDVWDWDNRSGPQTLSDRAYQIEGVLAHEYQHLLHNFIDPHEELFINEGCSMYTELVCGYSRLDSRIARYLFSPSNSLTLWQDQGTINLIADYGAAAAFMLYLADHFGGVGFVGSLIRNTLTGPASVTSTLGETGHWQWTYAQVFKAWRMANLIHADTPGNGLYNYRSIDIGAILNLNVSTYVKSDGLISRSQFLGPIYSMEGYDTGFTTVSDYGVDYYRLAGMDQRSWMESQLVFSGQRMITGDNWHLIEEDGVEFWSSETQRTSADMELVAALSLGSDPVFEFDSEWSIFPSFEYGFVQVSTDLGTSWQSLAFEYTTSDTIRETSERMIANLPGITGDSGGLVHINLDLQQYAGLDVLLGFRSMTGWGIPSPNGWKVNNFTLDGDALSLDAFMPAYKKSDYLVSLYFPATATLPARVTDVPIFSVTDRGIRVLAWFAGYDEAYLVVSPTRGPADYRLGLIGYGPVGEVSP